MLICMENVESLCNLVSTLCIKVKDLPDVPDIASGITEMSTYSAQQRASAIELWCDIESEPLVVETEIEEAKERFEALSISPPTATVEDDDDQADTNVDSTTTSKVSLNQFNDAMSVVYDFIVQRSSYENVATLHYQWIKTASELTKSYLEERAKSSSQPTIQQFFSVQKSNSTL